MLIVFPPVFEADTKIIYGLQFRSSFKVISLNEKFGKDILELQGYTLYIFQPFRFLRLWLYPITTIIKGTIYLLTSVMRVIYQINDLG